MHKERELDFLEASAMAQERFGIPQNIFGPLLLLTLSKSSRGLAR
jgi:hypothetical protein